MLTLYTWLIIIPFILWSLVLIIPPEYTNLYKLINILAVSILAVGVLLGFNIFS